MRNDDFKIKLKVSRCGAKNGSYSKGQAGIERKDNEEV
jgi:hypothetical protein